MKTILIVDDTKANIQILMKFLNEKYDLIASRDGQTAIDIAIEDKPDLILLDIMMPDMDGFETCKILKENSDTKNIPIIFITSKSDEDSIEHAFEIGGSDYITKPFKPRELLARINRELELVRLQDELKLSASTDPMTHLYNRRYLTKISTHILDLAKREKKELSLIMIDIDKFKNINDTYGHSIGDDVIIKFSDILQQNQRKSDIACRYGGEEFVLLLPETNIDGAKKVAEILRNKVEQNIITLESNESLKFTISLGLSNILTHKEINIETALNRADEALYEAKTNGRNRSCVK